MVIAASALLVMSACGDSDPTEPETPPAAPDVDGVWQSSTADRERTLQLLADGSLSEVEADFVGLACAATSGTWTATETTLTLNLGSSPQTVGYEVYADSLVLGSGSSAETYRPVSVVPDCGGYDFRRWTGTLTADIDSVSQTFANVSVTAAISSGLLEIRACPTEGPSCEVRDAELILKIDAPPGPLTAGSYPIQNNAIGQPNFFALIDPFPADPTFPGFNTERKEPPGVFDLTSLSDTRLVGTFEFQANEIEEGLSAPDGRRFVLVTNGVVELDFN
jgi:hypothetical protein